MEVLNILADLWKILPREEKEGIVVFLVSIPLGILSVVVALSRSDFFLAAAGVATLFFAAVVLVLSAGLILKLIVLLLRLVVDLLLLIPKWIKSGMLRLLGGEKQRKPATTDEEATEFPAPRTAERDGLGLLDFAFFAWSILVMFQIYRLLA